MLKRKGLLILVLILIIFGIFYLLNYFLYYANNYDLNLVNNKVAENTTAENYRDKINDLNLVIIATTIPNNLVAEKRRNNLVNFFSNSKVSILLNHGERSKDKNKNTFMTLKNSIKKFNKTTFKYGIVCDDDFFPINNFMQELNKTVKLLPKNWRSLHLCPGFAWGRKFKDNTKIGLFNPEKNMNDFDVHLSGRFFKNCNGKKYTDNEFWLGGPVCFLINNKSASNYLNEIKIQFNENSIPNDVLLTKILSNNDYICRYPQLGYEREEGGSTLAPD